MDDNPRDTFASASLLRKTTSGMAATIGNGIGTTP
jgi:hypothetical protein